MHVKDALTKGARVCDDTDVIIWKSGESWWGEEEILENEGSRAPIEKNIKYPKLIYNHFQYCDAVDVHNESRMFPITI